MGGSGALIAYSALLKAPLGMGTCMGTTGSHVRQKLDSMGSIVNCNPQ